MVLHLRNWTLRMATEEILTTLKTYETSLGAILSRFTKTRNAVHIAADDSANFRQIALELRDFFNDELVEGRRYGEMVLNAYANSVSNWLGTPSFHGVETVKDIVTTVLTRVKRSPSR